MPKSFAAQNKAQQEKTRGLPQWPTREYWSKTGEILQVVDDRTVEAKPLGCDRLDYMWHLKLPKDVRLRLQVKAGDQIEFLQCYGAIFIRKKP